MMSPQRVTIKGKSVKIAGKKSKEIQTTKSDSKLVRLCEELLEAAQRDDRAALVTHLNKV